MSILLNYGQSVDEASLINGIQNKETIQLNVEGGGTIPLSTSAIAENWVRVVFRQDKINYVYETKSGWSTDKNIPETYIKPENLSDEVMDVINSAVTAAIELPPVSADDNGRVFAVIDGQWTKVDLVDLMLEQGLYTPNLATDSWETISKISASGTAANYYAVGDAKAITLNGTMGTLALDMTAYVFILGFDHNAEIEGNGITFGGFKTLTGKNVVADAVDICLTDSGDADFTIDGSKHFNMNHWGEIYHGPKGDEDRVYNYGGWGGCDMRYDILGSTDVAPDNYGEMPTEGHHAGNDPTATCATNPVANTLMSCLPADLRAVMKPITKYTDNFGGGNGNVEANVTATVDYLPLCSEYEVHGQNSWANTSEVPYQAQYAYYAEGNSKVKNKHSDTSEAAVWWVRSPRRDLSISFCIVYYYGDATGGFAGFSYGVSPLLKV